MLDRILLARARSRRIGLAAGAAAATLVVALAAPTQAASSYTVPIPLNPMPANLTLIGASEAGVAVQQSALVAGYPEVDPVFTGPEGGELTPRRAVDPSGAVYSAGTMFAVSGDTLAWYERQPAAGSAPQIAHRLNILTGKDQVDGGTIAVPGAFNGDSWFSDAVLSYADYPSNWQRPLRQYHAHQLDSSGGMVTDLLIPNVSGVVGISMAADKTAVLRATSEASSGAGPTQYHLDIVNLKTRAVTRLLETTAEILDVALTDSTVVWSAKAAGGAYTVNQKPRAGGATTSYLETDQHADVAHLAAGPAGIGYLITDPADPADPYASPTTELAVVSGATAHDVPLPEGGSGLAAVGDHFLTAVGGYSGQAGVYRITGDDVTRVATVPDASLPPQALSLSAGTLRYSDQSDPDQPGLPVWQRTVSDGKRATFSDEHDAGRTSGSMAFSAARGVLAVPGQAGTWQFLDRSEETAQVEAVGDPNVSGPYMLIGGKVFHPDGEHFYTEPVPAGTTSGRDDLFGSRVVYVRTGTDGQSQIWLDDAEHPSPKLLASVPAGCDGQQPWVSIWGELVAWSSSCGDQVSVADVRAGTTRIVPTNAQELIGMSLSEGTLTWRTDSYYTVDHVLDLTSAVSVPVALPEFSILASIDGHQVAREVLSGPGGDLAPQPELMPLPFTPKYAPRLIAVNAPLGFTPNGDGHGDTWAPQFDVTKPLRSATLKITDYAGTKTLTQLEGTAPDGSVRDLTWNGLSSKGVQLPAGTYRWSLTGRAEDGDGALIAADGSPTVGGTIEIDLP
jgi:hypothetical protein